MRAGSGLLFLERRVAAAWPPGALAYLAAAALLAAALLAATLLAAAALLAAALLTAATTLLTTLPATAALSALFRVRHTVS